MNILVCGGRDYLDSARVNEVLSKLHYERTISIIAGGANGADKLAVSWALLNNVPYREFKANWPLHGRKAGSIRNQQMLDEGKPDLVIAFPGGAGTTDMVNRARRAGLPILEILL